MECTTGAAAPDRGPRVAMVVEQLWQSVPGGSGTYIVELARALRGRGVRLAGRGGPPLGSAGGLGRVLGGGVVGGGGG